MTEVLVAIEIKVEGQEDEHFVPENMGFVPCSNWDVSSNPEAKALIHMLGLLQSFTPFEVCIHTETC